MSWNRETEILPESDDTEIVAEYVQEIFRGKDNWGIHLLVLDGKPFKAKGECAFYLRAGMLITLYGAFEYSEQYGKTFNATTIMPYVPHPDSNFRVFAGWLRSGPVKYVGAAIANRILEHFGPETREKLSDVEALMQVRGIGAVLAPAIVESWSELTEYYRLAATLHGVGLHPGEIRLILQDFRDKDMRGIRQDSIEVFGRSILGNPYLLTRIAGLGFKRVDLIAQRLGIPEDSDFRQEAALDYACEQISQQEGHTLLYADWIIQAVCSDDILGGGPRKWPDIPQKLEARTRSTGHPLVSPYPDYFTSEHFFRAEKAVLAYAETQSSQLPLIPRQALEQVFLRYPFLTAEQKNALVTVTRNRFGMLTGGPGTGKTTCIKALCESCLMQGLGFVLLAPSGKAASRITESTGYPASTIHRYLAASKDGTGPSERHHLVVVDEASMVDSLLAEWLIRNLEPEQTLILVGDVHQLPSVSPGRVFGDLLDSGRYPSAELTQNHRSADIAGIPEFSQMIHRGIVPTSRDVGRLVRGGAHLRISRRGDAEETLSQIENTLGNWLRAGVPVSDIQVLSPTKKGPLGTQKLNRMLGMLLNPQQDFLVLGEDDFGPTEYAVGDRVIQLKNDYSVKSEPVYNGDMGIVTALTENHQSRGTFPAIEITFQRAGETFKRLYDADSIGYLTHAFAMTVHKSQGSEFSHLLLVLDSGHWHMLSRAILYTGVTRAKRELVLLTQERALRKAIETENSLRETCLYRFVDDLTAVQPTGKLPVYAAAVHRL